jgi:putative redox protein
MAVEISGNYSGQLKTAMSHGPSGVVLKTAAPADNRGDGSSYSPTDLVAAALASCMITTMAIVAEREAIPFPSASFLIEKHMVSDPRRIGSLPVRIEMPSGLSATARQRLEHIANTCPVMQSLNPQIDAKVEFVYPD